MDTERTDPLQKQVLLTLAQCSLHMHLLGHGMHACEYMCLPHTRAHVCIFEDGYWQGWCGVFFFLHLLF